MRAKVQIGGMAAMRSALRSAGDRAVRALGTGMYLVGEEIMTDAKKRAPVDTGAMRGSGYVTPPDVRGTRVTVEEGFGGAAKDYVIEQHENLALAHPVGEAKFLERAMDAARTDAGTKIAAVVRGALGGR